MGCCKDPNRLEKGRSVLIKSLKKKKRERRKKKKERKREKDKVRFKQQPSIFRSLSMHALTRIPIPALTGTGLSTAFAAWRWGYGVRGLLEEALPS